MRALRGPIACAAAALLAGCPSDRAAERRSRTVAALGDSITQGAFARPPAISVPYPKRLAQLLGPGWIVENLGAGGYGVREVRASWRRRAHGRGYRAAIVLAGTNDLRRGGRADDIWPTLSALYDEIRADGARLVVVTVPPFRGWAGDPWTEERPSEIRELNGRIARYCAANACAVADAHTLLADPEDPTALAPALDVGDHLHPSQAGLDRLAELVRTHLEP